MQALDLDALFEGRSTWMHPSFQEVLWEKADERGIDEKFAIAYNRRP